MSRGKEAAQSARRREQETAAKLASTEQTLASERQQRHEETEALRIEVRRLRAEHQHEAAVIAEERVARKLAEIEDERKRRGLSDDIAYAAVGRMERLIYNACRYISMTTGSSPSQALAMVVTWCTGKPLDQLRDPRRMIVYLNVPPDGWVAHKLKGMRGWVGKQNIFGIGGFNAIDLDTALREGHPDIHPRYKREWYRTMSADFNESAVIEEDEDTSSGISA